MESRHRRKNVIFEGQQKHFTAMDRKGALSDRAEPQLLARAFGRIGQALLRPFREIAARLSAALWLIVAVGVIMASLVVIGGLSKTFALIGFLSFVASVILLPRHEADQAVPAALQSNLPVNAGGRGHAGACRIVAGSRHPARP